MPNTNSNTHSSGNRITPARLNVFRSGATGATSNGTLAGSVAGPAAARRATFYIPAKPGYAELDFSTDDWHQVTFDGKIELRAASERLTFAIKKKDGSWSQNRDTVQKYDSTAISGRDVYSTTNPDDGHLGDWFNVCFNTDPSFNISAPYAHLKLQITKMYDSYIMAHSEISYRSISSKFCVVTSDWELDASEPNQNLRKFILNGHNSGMRIGIEGSLTVT